MKALPFESKSQFQQEKVRYLNRRATHLNAQNDFINEITNATQIVVNYDRVDGGCGCSGGSDKKSAS